MEGSEGGVGGLKSEDSKTRKVPVKRKGRKKGERSEKRGEEGV